MMREIEAIGILLIWATSWGGGLFIGYHEGKKAEAREIEIDTETTIKEQS